MKGNRRTLLAPHPTNEIVAPDFWLDSHIKQTKPWGNALQSSRPKHRRGNRLYEYAKSGAGAVQLQ